MPAELTAIRSGILENSIQVFCAWVGMHQSEIPICPDIEEN